MLLDAPSSDNLLKLDNSNNLQLFFLFFNCMPYFLIWLFGVSEVNTGRMRPPSPPCSTSMTPYWRVRVQVSVLKKKSIMLYFVKSEHCTAAESKVLKFFHSKHLFPGRYCAGRLVKQSGHQWMSPAPASENG